MKKLFVKKPSFLDDQIEQLQKLIDREVTGSQQWTDLFAVLNDLMEMKNDDNLKKSEVIKNRSERLKVFASLIGTVATATLILWFEQEHACSSKAWTFLTKGKGV